MTTRYPASLGHVNRLAAIAASALLVGTVACSDAQDTLLEAVDPDVINPQDIQNADGALALYYGALNRLKDATAGGPTNGRESTWLAGGLLGDEWSTSSTFVENDEIDERSIRLNNSTVTYEFRALARVRTTANQALAGLKQYRPTETSRIAEMYTARGFAELQLASDFCNGIPLSDASGTDIVYGKQLSVAEVFGVALASLDSALAINTGTDAQSVLVRNTTRVLKARAQLGLGQIAEAGATVGGTGTSAVPTSFSYDITFSLTTGDNGLWSQAASQLRYTVGDSLEGNGRNLLVRNATPFFSLRDPRVPTAYPVAANGRDTTKAQDGKTFVRVTTLWKQSSAVSLANGLDARLIEAEARLKAGDAPGMLAILNALRTAPPKLSEVQPTALAPLTDPGTADGRLNLLFREKAFWTFSRGQRLGDMRRLIRQYGRTPANTFPVGEHYRGGNYGADVNLPVPQDEQNNPNFKVCTDRNA
jgi:starch-binding outer membrane protein, SusD/RagB family